MAIEWNDSNELASGGTDEEPNDEEHDDDEDGGDESHIRMVKLVFTVDTIAEFKRQLRAAKVLLGTTNNTDTVWTVLRQFLTARDER